MTLVEDLAGFVDAASFHQLSSESRTALQVRVLDSLACAFGALRQPTPGMVRHLVDEIGGTPRCALVGGGRSAPDRAAFCNGALVRYLDFNDSYLAAGETCHPSDSFAPVLAGAEWAGASGRELLTALAVAYQVQCRLSDEAPVRARGFDHTTQLATAAAAGVAKALGLDPPRIAHAVAIAATSLSALRVTRTGRLSHWKGLAGPWAGAGATLAALTAAEGVTGPGEVFEGARGFMETVSGPFSVDWAHEGLDAVTDTVLKRFNAEIHSQSAIEALLDLRAEYDLDANQVERVELDIFQVGYDIIGGGAEGDKTAVRTKEEADHSLPYLLAVALLDGTVMPQQFLPERIVRTDVQRLLQRVDVHPAGDLTRRFPGELACRVRMHLRDGSVVEREKGDYEGWRTCPVGWERVVEKFQRLSAPVLDPGRAKEITEAVHDLHMIEVSDLAGLIAASPAEKEGSS